MASDIRSMGEMGGGTPTPTVVPVSNAAIASRKRAPKDAETDKEAPERATLPLWVWIAIVVVGVLILAFAGYYIIYPRLSSNNVREGDNAALQTSRVRTTLPAETAPTFFGHQSFFAKAPETLAVKMGGANGFTDARSYYEIVSELMAGTNQSETFFELEVSRPDGTAVSWPEFARVIEFLSERTAGAFENFKQDFTAFLYRDKHGVWPGYIMQVKLGKTVLDAGPKIRALEGDQQKFRELFFDPPYGEPTGFRDKLIATNPARVLSFENSTSTFSYLWFRNGYLILSTSEAGLTEALKRL